MTSFRAGAVTDTGRARAVNQDSLLVIDDRLYAVADGMGGHRGGEVASALALESLAGNLHEPSTRALVAGVTTANQVVHERSSADPELRGMGTTLIALALIVGPDGDERLAMANVGDSRAYRYRGDHLEQITEDHSLVESLVRQGRITPEEAATHPQRNIITRALGVDPQVEVDAWELPAVAGDRYLLCSDGLFNEVESATIAATLQRHGDPTEAAHELGRLANEGGGRDNITCVVVDVLDGSGRPDDEVARVGTASEPDLGGYGPATTPMPVASVFDAPAPPPVPPARPAGVGPGGGHAAAGSSGRGLEEGPTGSDGAPALIGAIPDHLPDDEGEPPPPPRRPRRFTWRVAVFVLALIALVGAVAGALVYYGRNTYYVAFNGAERVTIFRGRPDSFLLWDPTVERVTTISSADLRDTAVADVAAQPDQPTLADAEGFVANLCDRLRSTATPAECSATAATGDRPTTGTTATTAPDGAGIPGSGGGASGDSGTTGGPLPANAAPA